MNNGDAKYIILEFRPNFEKYTDVGDCMISVRGILTRIADQLPFPLAGPLYEAKAQIESVLPRTTPVEGVFYHDPIVTVEVSVKTEFDESGANNAKG